MPEPPTNQLDAEVAAPLSVLASESTTTSLASESPRTSAIPDTPAGFAEVLGRLKVGRYTGVLLLAIFIAVFGLWVPDTFLTSTTIKTILSTQGVTAVIALAVVFPLAAGAFDLSVASNTGLSALLCGGLMANAPHLSPILAILITLCVAMCVGALNGFFVAIVGVNSFIATLGVGSLLEAALAKIGNGNYFGPFPNSFSKITSPDPLGIPMVALYVLALAILGWYVLEHTPVGRRVYATGANPDAARLSGVRTRRYLFMSLVVCGLGAGIAGVLLASSTGSVNQTVGESYLLPGYAAAFLATTQIKPGRFNIWGTVLAVVLLGTGIEGLQLVGAQIWVTSLFNGVALLGAVSVAVLLERLRNRRETAQVQE